MRPKRGQEVSARLNELLNSPVSLRRPQITHFALNLSASMLTRADFFFSFSTQQLFDTIRKEKPNELKKVTPINGDITLHQLGISESDQAMLCRNVSIVFHSAATVKFDEKLELSVKINMLGTKRLVELCHRMMNLDVSTEFSSQYQYR